MPIVFRAMTANCANDTLGEVSRERIKKLLLEERLDFLMVTCQEAHFDKVQSQLLSSIHDLEYQVICLAKMNTHTKLMQQFNHDTGLATFILHKKSWSVLKPVPIVARRGSNRLKGSAFNKGGVIAKFLIQDNQSQEQYIIHGINAHLDSQEVEKRIQDWCKLHEGHSSTELADWDALVAYCPHLVIAGYDANTRDKFTVEDPQRSTNLLLNEPDNPEIQALYRMPLAAHCYAATTTYDKSNQAVKRQGYANRGMLDFVGISDGVAVGDDLSVDTANAELIDCEPSSKRDHQIVMSSQQTYNMSGSDFEKIKHFMVSRLFRIAPLLCETIKNLADDETNKAFLLETYNTFLSVDGLANQSLKMHLNKLQCYRHITEKSNFSVDAQNQIYTILFEKPMNCDGSIERINYELKLMQHMLDSLLHCKNESTALLYISCYQELKSIVKPCDSEVEPIYDFKTKLIQDFLAIKNQLLDILKSKNTEFIDDRAVLALLDELIVKGSDSQFFAVSNKKSVEQIHEATTYCYELCRFLNAEVLEPNEYLLGRLDKISKAFSEEPNLLIKALGELINLIIKLIDTLFKSSNPSKDKHSETKAPIERVSSIGLFKSGSNYSETEVVLPSDASILNKEQNI